MHVYLFIHYEILYFVPQDTQFSQILQDSLDFFNIPEEDYPLYFLVDTKSSQFIFVAYIHIYYIFTIAKRDVRLIYWLLHCVLGYIMKYLQSLMHTGQLFLTLHSYLSI